MRITKLMHWKLQYTKFSKALKKEKYIDCVYILPSN